MAAAAAATAGGISAPILRTAIPRRRRARLIHPSATREATSENLRRRVQSVVTRAAPPSSPARDKANSKSNPRSSSTSSSSSPLPPLSLQSIDDDSADAVVILGRRWWDWNSWTPRGRGLVLLNILVLLCASNWVVVKQATDAAAPANFTALRFLVAAAAFAPFLPRAKRETFSAGLELGFWSAAGYATQALGLMTTDASRASFLSAFTVVAVPLLSGTRVAGQPKAVEPITWLCAASAILGVFLLEDAAVDPGPGDAWALASSLLAVTVATVAAISAAAAGILACTGEGSSVASALQAAREWLSHPGEALATDLLPRAPELLWTGLLSTDAVLLIELVALRDVSSIDAAIIYTLEPVMGAFLAWLILGERFGPLGCVGAAIILSSALAAQLVGGKGDEEGKEKKA